MNSALEQLWNDAVQRLEAVAADQQARGIQPMPESFPIIGSFAFDDPDTHAHAFGDIVDGSWSDAAVIDTYCVEAPLVAARAVGQVIRPASLSAVEIDFPEIPDWATEPLAAPLAQSFFCVA